MKGFPQIIHGSKGQWYQRVNAVIDSVNEGDTLEKLVELLGEADTIHSTKNIQTPSQFFENIGSIFRFGDEMAEEVWEYQDPYRPRRRYEFYIQNGRIINIWKKLEGLAKTEREI